MTQEKVSGIIVLFGATGDLASRKLYPSLFHLYERHLLSEQFAVIGTARREWDDNYFKQVVKEAIKAKDPDAKDDLIATFSEHFYYVPNDASKIEHFVMLKDKILTLKEKYQTGETFLYYLSIAPNLFEIATKNIKKSGIVDIEGTHSVILEKPFGNDQTSANELNDALLYSFKEENIYRIDHYIGKDTVQNIWSTRMNNAVIEGIWNKDFIDHIQITLSEDMPVGTRGGYYDKNGALLDMFQNHILQVMAFVGMDLPKHASSKCLHQAKIAFFKSLETLSTEDTVHRIIRGQYGMAVDDTYPAYRDEPEVPSSSNTETYIAGKFNSTLSRWQGVPFYFRTGKILSGGKYTTVDIVFKSNHSNSENPPRMSYIITPEEGLSLTLQQKVFSPEPASESVTNAPQPSYYEDAYIAESYETLIYNAFKGDNTLFVSMDELNEQWRIVDAIREAWKKLPAPKFPNYPAYSKGPEAADQLIQADHRQWIKFRK